MRLGWHDKVKKLTKKELLHIVDTTKALEGFENNLKHQKYSNTTCYTCKSIARKVGLEV